jgi:hypothetical protein
MTAELKFADTDAEKEGVFRHRYEVYVEEMGRYHAIADHDRRMLVEDIDADSRFLYADLDGQVIGSMRWTWGGDAPMSKRHIDQYMLQPFIDTVPQAELIVGERFMVTKEYRGSDVLSRMFQRYMNFVNEMRIQLIFGDCEPHLLNLYQGLGFRTYSSQNISSSEVGYLIPLILVAEDLDYLRAIRSPMAEVLTDFGDDSRVPENLPALLRDSAVQSERLVQRETYWAGMNEVFAMIGQERPTFFAGLSNEVVQPFLAKSNIIECRAGDQILKKGNVAQNMFIVLSGRLEVRDDGKVIQRLAQGDLLGEVAFLLGQPRSADVFAVEDGTTILSLSETSVRKHIEDDPKVAAQVLLNVAKMLCQKLVS